MAEYIHEFTRLSCFAPELDYTDEKKMERFVERLRSSIQNDVTGWKECSFSLSINPAKMDSNGANINFC